MPEPTFEELIEAMKAGAGAFQLADVPFVLGGGCNPDHTSDVAESGKTETTRECRSRPSRS